MNDTRRHARTSTDRRRDGCPSSPSERIAIGRTGLTTTRLGLGGASIGGLFRPVDDADAIALVEHAWDIGIRSSMSRRCTATATASAGWARRSRAPAARRVRPLDQGRPAGPSRADIPADADIDRQSRRRPRRRLLHGLGDRGVVFDYSGDGVRRSLEESLERLGLARIDIALHPRPGRPLGRRDARRVSRARAAARGGHRPRDRRRDEPVGDARPVRRRDRYRHRDAGRPLHPARPGGAAGPAAALRRARRGGHGGRGHEQRRARGSAAGAHFDYRPAPDPVVDRVRRMAAVCERHGVPLRAAAIQFALAHPVGHRADRRASGRPPTSTTTRRPCGWPIPAALWDDLRAEGLIPAEAPVPG